MSKISEVAILIDGGFFIQRFKKMNKGKDPLKADIENLIQDIMNKVTQKSNGSCIDVLYRSYYYDCFPFGKIIKDINGNKIDFSQTKIFNKKEGFINSLKDIDQFALRLGELSFSGWKIDAKNPKSSPYPNFRQKGVDMKIGLDMAWMSSKNIVNKIVLVAGDSDFISPIKLVRREGLMIYLYPMNNHLKSELIEHSDFIL